MESYFDDKAIRQLFEKKFTLSGAFSHAYTLPEEPFISEPWEEERFLDLKEKLNEQKSRLNDYRMDVWQRHTHRTNPAKDIATAIRTNVSPELFTIAWTKFYECAVNYETVSSSAINSNTLNSLHLCEAPGAFIAALNHFLKSQYPDMNWKWRASTLNPYYEGNSMSNMVNDDRLIKHTLNHWNFGIDYTGNIMNWENSQSIIKSCEEMGEVQLVTADGSIDCSLKPEDQESIVSSLHFCEAITALQALCEGGTFILKLFTLFEHSSINLMYLLAYCFTNIELFKPITSKPGNSEVYIICLKYRGFESIKPFVKRLESYYGTEDFLKKSLFFLNHIPSVFLEELLKASNFFYDHQYDTIDRNINIFENPHHKRLKIFRDIPKLQQSVKNMFMMQTQLKPINDEDRICGCWIQSVEKLSAHHHLTSFESFTERKNAAEVLDFEKISKFDQDMQKMSKTFHILPISLKCEMLPKTSVNFTYGKVIKKYQNSKFVFVQVFKMLVKFDLLKADNAGKSHFEKNRYGYSVIFHEIINHENPIEKQKQDLELIYKTLKLMKHGESLCLHNYNTLTQLNVGILYALAMIGFDYIVFCDNFSINLNSLQNKKQVIDFLISLLADDKLFSTDISNRSILGILPLKCILSNPFYNTVCNYNNVNLTMKFNEKVKSILTSGQDTCSKIAKLENIHSISLDSTTIM